jgi:hypothetical protein
VSAGAKVRPAPPRRAAIALLALAAAMVVVFLCVRATSPVEAALANAAARACAEQTGVPLADVMALDALHGGGLAGDDLAAACARLAQGRAELGDDLLAVAAAAGHEQIVREILAAVGSPAEAAARLRELPEGLIASRFCALRERVSAAAWPAR